MGFAQKVWKLGCVWTCLLNLHNRLWGLLGPQRSKIVHIFVIHGLHLPLFLRFCHLGDPLTFGVWKDPTTFKVLVFLPPLRKVKWTPNETSCSKVGLGVLPQKCSSFWGRKWCIPVPFWVTVLQLPYPLPKKFLFRFTLISGMVLGVGKKSENFDPR